MAEDELKTGQKVADWDAAYDEYLALKRSDNITLVEFAAKLGVRYTYTSLKFAAIKRERLLNEVKLRLPGVMHKALKKVTESLDEEADYSKAADRAGLSPDFKRRHELEVFKVMADRLGLSPQGVMVNIQQNNTQAVVMPPIFGSPYVDGVKQMLKVNDEPEA